MFSYSSFLFNDMGDDYNPTAIELLIADADLALTFTEIALAHLDRPWALQTIERAQRAYDVIRKERAELRVPECEASAIDSKLSLLKSRLQELSRLRSNRQG